MRGKCLVALALWLALLTACTGEPEEPSPSGMAPFESTQPIQGILPTGRALCDMEALYIEADGDAALEAQISQVLIEMDMAVFLAAALIDPAVRVAYDADEMSERDAVFQWTLLQRALSHFAPEGQVTVGAQVKAPRGVVEDYWRACFQIGADDTMPDIPADMAGEIQLQGAEYVITPPDGVYPPVCLVLAYTIADEDGRECLAVYADVLRGNNDMPIPAQVLLIKREDGRYVLLSSGLDAGEEDVFTDYTVTSYQAVVSLPAECALLARDESSVSFAAPNGLLIEITEERFIGKLSDHHASEAARKTALIADYVSPSEMDYGIVWDDGSALQYDLVRMMEQGALVRVSVTVPRDWALDYFFLPEMVMESFGGEPIPVDASLAIEEYLLS